MTRWARFKAIRPSWSVLGLLGLGLGLLGLVPLVLMFFLVLCVSLGLGLGLGSGPCVPIKLALNPRLPLGLLVLIFGLVLGLLGLVKSPQHLSLGLGLGLLGLVLVGLGLALVLGLPEGWFS